MPTDIRFECPTCGKSLKAPAGSAGREGRCSGCRAEFRVPAEEPEDVEFPDDEDDSQATYNRRAVRRFAGNKVAAGVCGILLGCLGVHKFIIGLTTPGLIMVLVSVCTFGIGAIPMALIGLAEGIIYLTKSDREFYELYAVEQKPWF